MDLKIKKESRQERVFEIPKFGNSEELEKELEAGTPRAKVQEKETINIKQPDDELKLTTQTITTELKTDDINKFEIDTQDLEDDLQISSRLENDKSNADTIKIQSEQQFTDTYIEKDKDKEPLKINIKYIYGAVMLIVLIVLFIVIAATIAFMTSEKRYINQALENQLPISDVNVYGESINFISDEMLQTITLVNVNSKKLIDKTIGVGIDEGLNISNLDKGSYYVYSDDQILTSENDIEIEFQTITREGRNKDVYIKTIDNNLVIIDIKDATSKKLDILIDPSQGEVQGFLGTDGVTSEQQLSLKYATALQMELESLGYNVKLTREDDSVPGDCLYNDAYCDKGRVALAYIDNPKLYIQIGFNGSGGSGFEITDSTLNSHTLARLIKSSLESSLTPSTRVSGQLEPGIYNKTYDLDDGTKADYIYLIRETGGTIMNSDNEQASAYNTNKVGAEAIEINLGYMEESEDFNKISSDEQINKIAKALANAIDQYINKDEQTVN